MPDDVILDDLDLIEKMANRLAVRMWFVNSLTFNTRPWPPRVAVNEYGILRGMVIRLGQAIAAEDHPRDRGDMTEDG